jgi:hypothetical protein
VNESPRPSPEPSAIGIELSPRKLVVRSGRTGRVKITLRNLTAAPLTLDLSEACGATFETMLLSSDDTRVDFPEETCHVRAGPSCTVVVARIVLGPHGVARLRVPVRATKTLVTENCHPASIAPIEPGTYKLVVYTPFTRPIPNSDIIEARQVTGQLTVVARRRNAVRGDEDDD